MACSGKKENLPYQPEDDYEMVEKTDCACICYTCQQENKQLKTYTEQLQSQIQKLENQIFKIRKCYADELHQLKPQINEQEEKIDASKKVQSSQKGPDAQSEYCVVGNVDMAKEKSYDDSADREIQDSLIETKPYLKKNEKNQNEARAEQKHNKDKLLEIKAELRKSKEQLSNTKAEQKHNEDKFVEVEAELRKSKEQLSNTKAELKHTENKFVEVEAELRKSKEQRSNTEADLKHNKNKLLGVETEFRKCKEQLNITKAELKRTNDKLKETEAELDVTKTRLSKAMGAKLTDNNPDITDLSDQNRPTKLAEKYQELYDNQWTDAYEIIESKYKNKGEGNRNAISTLIKILMETKEFCENEAASQTNVMQKAIILGRVPKGTDKCIHLPQAVLKEIKDFRRKVAAFSMKEIYKIYQNRLSHSNSSTAEVAKIVPEFVEKCFEICWLMTVQDPPLAFGPNIKRGDRFDTNMYKAYTKSGRKYDFVVWPALLLHQNGPVLSKGIAQGHAEDNGH